MATEIILPKVDMVMENGTFVEWLKNEGDQVKKGDPLFVILTDKATIEIESPADGILAGLSAKPDDIIPVTSVIGYVIKEGEKVPNVPKVIISGVKEQLMTDLQVEKSLPLDEIVEQQEQLIRATPLARKMAGELGLDLTKIKGRGPRGRIYRNAHDLLCLSRY